MTPADHEDVTFETTLTASGNLVTVNGYEYRSTVAVMGGRYLISLSAAVRAATGLKGGDPISVVLTVADTPREVEVPADFAAAMEQQEPARQFFDGLSSSLQRYHVDNVNAAKAPETRQRRIDKSVGLFLAGRQR
jgi:hypothetical protein